MKMHSLNGHNLNGNDYKNLFKHTNNKKSIELSLWDKFCDLFRSNKKQDVINLFYNLITPLQDESLNSELKIKLEQFEKLKNMADPVNRELFKTHIQELDKGQKEYTFSIDDTNIYKFVSENNWNSLSKITLG
ncbi:pathogenicity island 1 protein SopD2, partial [Yersinia artesiana]|uniref:pathogenicity island 1 protein SopD2 n=3 Tax=Yersinia artesiana TaxID=2890315 RepID=UPI001F216FF3